jgi:hypothetical protein
MKRWTPEETELLKKYYPTKGLVFCATLFDVPNHRVRIKASALGLKQDRTSEFFKDWQSRAAQSKVGKKRPAQALVMKSLHNTGKMKQTQQMRDINGKRVSEFFKKNGHPRGMLGKKHSKEVCARLSKIRKGVKLNISKEQHEKRSKQQSESMQKRLREHGTFYSRGTQSWHTIGGQRHFFRSSWEVVYAKYLQSLVENNTIISWEFEPVSFKFSDTTHSVRSYTPDFRITNLDKSIEFHEVKGYVDKKSIIKSEKMAKEYPDTVLKIIGEKEYYALPPLVLTLSCVDNQSV